MLNYSHIINAGTLINLLRKHIYFTCEIITNYWKLKVRWKRDCTYEQITFYTLFVFDSSELIKIIIYKCVGIINVPNGVLYFWCVRTLVSIKLRNQMQRGVIYQLFIIRILYCTRWIIWVVQLLTSWCLNAHLLSYFLPFTTLTTFTFITFMR